MRFIISILFLLTTHFNSYSQDLKKDTISGNYINLNLSKGHYIIKEVVFVKGIFSIDPGSRIELIENGRIVCEGSVSMIGVNHDIEIYGKIDQPGVGLVIKNMDSSKVELSNVIFRNLQLPLLFDFGWKRNMVTISNNQFLNNYGKVSVIQVLDQPFSVSYDSSYSIFNINSNLFSGNNAPLYFEDFNSDHIKITIKNNSFVNNKVYGFKNYNIATNILYGRSDQFNNKYAAVIEQNSFVSNYLIDSYTDSLVHLANFGIYGSDKKFNLKNNYINSSSKYKIENSIYDQTINYSSPKIDFEPFLIAPLSTNPTHIYLIQDSDQRIIEDTQRFSKPIKEFSITSNNTINFVKAQLVLSHFLDDSTELLKFDTLLFTPSVNKLNTRITIANTPIVNSKLVAYKLNNLLDDNGNYVPDVNIGSSTFQYEFKKRKPFILVSEDKSKADTITFKDFSVDSVKDIFQKIETSVKSKFEFGLFSGGAIFLGTISNSNYFKNDINLFNAFSINYKLYSKLSLNINIASFSLSNSDFHSDNNEQISRGMNFNTSMLSISPSIDIDFVDNRLYTKARKLRPSLGFGVDLISFNPTSIYKGTTYNLQPLGTGGQLLDSTHKVYSLFTQGYFLDAKLKFQFSRRNSIGVHCSIHKSISDYLDDVGPDAYPDPTKLYNSTKTFPEAAVYFSNPTTKTLNYGQLRNNPTSPSDMYLIFGLFYTHKF
ncbi:MAG: DUF6089 family protein [Chitinophagia bacterium]